VIRNMERQRCDDMQLPETLLGRHPEGFPPLVLPSDWEMVPQIGTAVRGIVSFA
jgi:hypothetical protein